MCEVQRKKRKKKKKFYFNDRNSQRLSGGGSSRIFWPILIVKLPIIGKIVRFWGIVVSVLFFDPPPRRYLQSLEYFLMKYIGCLHSELARFPRPKNAIADKPPGEKQEKQEPNIV